MLLTFYKNDSDHNVIGKKLTELKTITINFKKNDSVLYPSLLLNRENIPEKCNYCFIDGTKRFYFIDEITEKNKNQTLIGLYVDVLETYKDVILNSTATITKKAEPSYFNGMIESDTRKEFNYYYSNVTIEEKNTMILTAIGG